MRDVRVMFFATFLYKIHFVNSFSSMLHRFIISIMMNNYNKIAIRHSKCFTFILTAYKYIINILFQ